MSKIGDIYVEIRGDAKRLKQDLEQAKAYVTEVSHSMANNLNQSLSAGQIQSGLKSIVTNLSTLNNASKVTGTSFKALGVDLKELQGITGLTKEKFDVLQRQFLETRHAKIQEKALRDIAKQAGLTKAQIQDLGSSMGVSAPGIDRVTNSIHKAAAATETFVSRMKTMIATVAIYSVGFQAVSRFATGIKDEFIGGLKAVEDFNVGVATSAAFITTFSQQARTGDLAGAYQKAAGYAELLANKLEMVDAQTIASGKDLQVMSETFIQHGVLLDINNQKQVDGFTNIATALAFVTAGQNKDIQMRQEINALLNGQFRATDRVARLLLSIDPQLKSHLELWKEQGTIIENVGELLKGFNSSTGTLDDQWVTVGSTMETIHNRILRDAFKPMFNDLIGLAKFLNSSLMDVNGNLTGTAIGIQEIIKGAYEGIKAIAEMSKQIIKDMANVIPGVSTFKLASGLLSKAGLPGPGDLLDYIDPRIKWQDQANERARERNRARNDAPGLVPFKDDGSDAAAAAKKAERERLKLLNQEVRNYTNHAKDASKSLRDWNNNTEDAIKGINTLNASFAKEGLGHYAKAVYENNRILSDGTYVIEEYSDSVAEVNNRIKQAVEDYTKVTSNLEKAKEKLAKNIAGGSDEDINKVHSLAEAQRKLGDEIEQLDINQRRLTDSQSLAIQTQDELIRVARESGLAGAYRDAYGEIGAYTHEMYEMMMHDAENERDAFIRLTGDKVTAQKLFKEQVRGLELSDPANAWTKGIEYGFEDIRDLSRGVGSDIASFITGAFQESSDALADFVTTGKLDFADLADSIVNDLMRIAMQQALTGIFSNISLGAGTSLSSIDAGAVPYHHFGGIAGSEPSFYKSLPKFHNGLMPDEFPAVLQKGEGVFTKGQMAAMGKSTTNVNIYNNGGGTVTQKEKPNDTGGVDLEIVFDNMMAKNVGRTGSATNRALMATTGSSQPLMRR